MSLLDEIKDDTNGPVMGTICGDAGMGKTSFAASFPGSIIIRVEDGLKGVHPDSDVKPLPLAADIETVRSQLKMVLEDEHDFKTLIIDSVTELDPICSDYVLNKYNSELGPGQKKANSINTACGGYGNGPVAVGAMHRGLVKYCEKIKNERGMNVIFIAHAALGNIDLPDADPYQRYTLQMNEKHSMPPYINKADFVGFIRHEILVKTEDGQRSGKIIGGAPDRYLDVLSRPSSIAKNRLRINKLLPFNHGENPILDYINN